MIEGFSALAEKKALEFRSLFLREYKTEEAAIWVEKVSEANALHYSCKSTEAPCGERRKVE